MSDDPTSIGNLMKELGLAQEQVDQAVQLHKEKGIRLGEALVQLGFASQETVDAALGLQQAHRSGRMTDIKKVTSGVVEQALTVMASLGSAAELANQVASKLNKGG